MPHLKNKLIRNALKASTIVKEEENVKVEPSEDQEQWRLKHPVKIFEGVKEEDGMRNKPSKPIKQTNMTQAKKSANSAKNIVKNFARAMVNFAISRLALPYLEPRLREFKLDLKSFQKYLTDRRENMDGISSLRNLLLIGDDDDVETASIKTIFRYTSEIFVKFFSVNWIFNSKLGDKIVHVKSRFKILRRIRNPEYFTYFKL